MQISEEAWRQFHEKLKNKAVIGVLQRLFDFVLNTLAQRIDEIKIEEGKAISFFSCEREFLTINVTRKDLRIYIHPTAKPYFDPEAKFQVEKFRFWDASYQKSSGKYCAMSVWISEAKYLPGLREIIGMIPLKRSPVSPKPGK